MTTPRSPLALRGALRRPATVLFWLGLLGALACVPELQVKDDAPASSGTGGSGGAAPACDAGETLCDSDCVDTKNDPQHCGACGKACGDPANATASCAMGACGIGMCTAGFGDCDMNAVNGCEVTFANDPQHCGACGKACGATSQCDAGGPEATRPATTSA
ncbi:MAG: hypothetical protein FJ095_20010 [Deltaproteobacteria bacterium]|nr:hypothetical protein [Deltaproteobacteria bacterium]